MLKSSRSYSLERPAVGCSVWLGLIFLGTGRLSFRCACGELRSDRIDASVDHKSRTTSSRASFHHRHIERSLVNDHLECLWVSLRVRHTTRGDARVCLDWATR